MRNRGAYVFGMLLAVATQVDAETTELVSATLAGLPGTGNLMDVSPDGRWVLFSSAAPDIVSGDSNGRYDVFLRDRQAGRTIRVNVSSSEQQANGDSDFEFGGSVSPDGRYAVFASQATNLVTGDTNGVADIFLRDTAAGTTERINVTTTGAQAQGNVSYYPIVSADGRYVVFGTAATNLTTTAHDGDTYRRDRLSRTTTLVRFKDATGRCDPTAMTDDGRYVISHCGDAQDQVYWHDFEGDNSGLIRIAGIPVVGTDVSNDGRYIVLETRDSIDVKDTNQHLDVYVFDLSDHDMTWASLTNSGGQGNGHSYGGTISDDGRYVAFISSATDLTADDTRANPDMFVRDRLKGTTTLVSVASTGVPQNGWTYRALISDDGGTLAFSADGNNVVPSDDNYDDDVFVRQNGSGAAPAAYTVRPRELAFGTIAVGTKSAPRTVTVTNTGGTPPTIGWVGVAGSSRTQFERERQCPGALAPGASCTVTVTFHPDTAGTSAARLVVSTGDGTRKSASLSGTGL